MPNLDGVPAFIPPGGGVAATRAINTTSPLPGGGDLSADRTFALDLAATYPWTAAHTFTLTAVGTAQTIVGQFRNTTAAAAGAPPDSPGGALTGEGREKGGGA